MAHLRVYIPILITLIGLLAGAFMHSQSMKARLPDSRTYKTLARILPSPDPGINNSARYIRHLGISTFQSAFPDFPGQIDYLPSGMTWPPPAGINSSREPVTK